jgi:hypothetical protein
MLPARVRIRVWKMPDAMAAAQLPPPVDLGTEEIGDA